MSEQLLKHLRDLRESYWFIPSLMTLASVLLALVTSQLDARFELTSWSKFAWLYDSEAQGARAVLSAIATSMIGVAGVTFSMTIVSVSFAGANVGPRLITNLMRDRGNQITLGTFIATFVYCLLVLRIVTDASTVPHISLVTAQVLALGSIGVLIYFIHHIPESINVERITWQVGEELEVKLNDLFGEPSPTISTRDERPTSEHDGTGIGRVLSLSSGYLQAMDREQLVAAAKCHDVTIALEYRPGDFVTRGSALARIDGQINEELSEAICRSCVLGTRRTLGQDPVFLVNQLVEIMARALSPGVNDPFTAVSCIDWLRRGLTTTLDREPPNGAWEDEEGIVRVWARRVDVHTLLDAAFGQSLQYVCGDEITALHAMHALCELAANSVDGKTTGALLQQAKRLDDAGDECLKLASTREKLKQRYAQTVSVAGCLDARELVRDDDGWLRRATLPVQTQRA